MFWERRWRGRGREVRYLRKGVRDVKVRSEVIKGLARDFQSEAPLLTLTFLSEHAHLGDEGVWKWTWMWTWMRVWVRVWTSV